jgi:hypothetical protein
MSKAKMGAVSLREVIEEEQPGEVIIEGWADEIEVNRKSIHALVRMKAGNPGFSCKNCGNWYQPQPEEWIVHLLCRECFTAFDRQKKKQPNPPFSETE